MGRNTTKTFSIDVEVAERLEEEDNQSEVVEEALKEYWRW